MKIKQEFKSFVSKHLETWLNEKRVTLASTYKIAASNFRIGYHFRLYVLTALQRKLKVISINSRVSKHLNFKTCKKHESVIFLNQFKNPKAHLSSENASNSLYLTIAADCKEKELQNESFIYGDHEAYLKREH